MPFSNGGKSKKPEYTVQILPSALKLLNKLPNSVASKLEDKMMALAHDPRPPGYKKLKGRDAYRIRMGDIVLFTKSMTECWLLSLLTSDIDGRFMTNLIY
jgi:mRNA-degrading endonuclease RelE of RelBE toxin-antitoxin system